MTNLNFSISELVNSDTAKRFNVKNMPDLKALDNMLNLIFYILQPLRDKFGSIRVTSGYRCEQLNKILKGAINSNHLYGCAVDIIPQKATFKQVYDFIVNNLDYDECFIEKNLAGSIWLHIAFRKNNNRKKHNSNYIA